MNFNYGFTGTNYYTGNNLTGAMASPAGRHFDEVFDNRSRFSGIEKSGYHFQQKRLPGAGTNNYALETLALSEFSPIGGGVMTYDHLKVTQPSYVYVNSQMVVTNGLGGLVTGQMVYQPLLNPQNQTYGGF